MHRFFRRAIGLGLTVGLAGLAALTTALAQTDQPPKATYVGTYVWPAKAHNMGGFSGLEVAADGARFVAISDRGGVVKGSFQRSNGVVTNIRNGPPAPLRNPRGKPLNTVSTDAEGLAMHPDGRLFVSFEGRHRVWSYAALDAAKPLPRPQIFRNLQSNSGLEALAIDVQGRLYAIPERSGHLKRPFPIWRLENGRWSHVADLPREGGFLVVGADFGPDGQLYVLERAFTGIGFQSRVRRVALAGAKPLAPETLLITPTRRHDNLEGLAVWRAPDGAIVLTMISDDNFRPLIQRTEIVEYRLPPPNAG